MFDNFLMSINTKLKKIISNLATNEEKIDVIGTDVVNVQTTTDAIADGLNNTLAPQLQQMKADILAEIASSSGSSTASVIKSIQRGVTTSATVTLATAVDPNKCFVILNNQYVGNDGSGYGIEYGMVDATITEATPPTGAYLVSLTSTTLKIGGNKVWQDTGTYASSTGSEFVAVSSLTGTISWQVIEFY